MRISTTMPAAEYHARPEISHSQLKSMARSPWDFWKRHRDPDRPPPEPSTPTQLLGEHIHCAVLEPERFRRAYVQGPAGCTRAASRWKEFEAEHKGKHVLKPDEYETVTAAAAAVRAHPLVVPLLHDQLVQTEVSIFFELHGVACRARLDLLCPIAIADVKTAAIDPWEFQRQAERNCYHTQAAFYQEAAKQATGTVGMPFLFIAVEPEWPFKVLVYRAGPDFMAHGRRKVEQWLNEYAACMENNAWPGYNEHLIHLDLPHWSKDND